MMSNQVTSLSTQLAASQGASERLTGLWRAAERGKQFLLRAAGQREVQAAAFAVERMQAQVGGSFRGCMKAKGCLSAHCVADLSLGRQP